MVMPIVLSRGYVALVDDCDYEELSQWRWCAQPSPRTVYAMRKRTDHEACRQITVKMHRHIMSYPIGLEVDHIDGDGLNNTRANLRIATHIQNGRNRRLDTRSTTGMKGVSLLRDTGKYISYIYAGGKKTHLGTYNTPEDAHQARREAAARIHGEFANFEEAR